MALDNETKKVLTDGEKLRLMTEHEGWGIARSLLSSKILELQQIGDLIKLEPVAMAIQAKANQAAAEILFTFLTEIEGTVEQHLNNNPVSTPIESYILREK